jgi:hypothetical protein
LKINNCIATILLKINNCIATGTKKAPKYFGANF